MLGSFPQQVYVGVTDYSVSSPYISRPMRFLSLIGLAAAFTPYQSDLVLATLAPPNDPHDEVNRRGRHRTHQHGLHGQRRLAIPDVREQRACYCRYNGQ